LFEILIQVVSSPLLHRLLHIGAAVILVGGILGRNLAMQRAARSADMPVVTALVALAGRFEALMVRPGSLLVFAAGILLVLVQGRPLVGEGHWWLSVSLLMFLSIIPVIALVFVPRGRHFEAALAEARESGSPTPRLAAAFADPVVAAAHRYELLAIAVVGFLMVVKPF
jgi:uncharacterized membrane protein